MRGQRNVCSMNRMLSSVGILLDKESREYLTPRSVRSRNGPSHVMYKKYDNSMGWLIITVDSYDFSIIAAPLSDLFKSQDNDKRKRRPIIWGTNHQVAFQRLKQAVTTAPVLVQPNPAKTYTIETDSSDFGPGMALYQQGEDGKLHPVAFDGRKLHGAELKYPTHEKELLAIKDALKKWHHYVENGLPITVITDHDSLKYMNTIQNPSKRMARWVDKFQ